VLINDGDYYLLKTPFGLVGWAKFDTASQDASDVEGIFFMGDLAQAVLIEVYNDTGRAGVPWTTQYNATVSKWLMENDPISFQCVSGSAPFSHLLLAKAREGPSIV
jgi:hypothetical protein